MIQRKCLLELNEYRRVCEGCCERRMWLLRCGMVLTWREMPARRARLGTHARAWFPAAVLVLALEPPATPGDAGSMFVCDVNCGSCAEERGSANLSFWARSVSVGGLSTAAILCVGGGLGDVWTWQIGLRDSNHVFHSDEQVQLKYHEDRLVFSRVNTSPVHI